MFYLDDVHASVLEDLHEEPVDFDFNAQELLDQIPDAYRMVFNLYVIEEYSHRNCRYTQYFFGSKQNSTLQSEGKTKKDLHQQQKQLKNEHLK